MERQGTMSRPFGKFVNTYRPVREGSQKCDHCSRIGEHVPVRQGDSDPTRRLPILLLGGKEGPEG